MLPKLPRCEAKQFKAFRNVYAIKDSQALFDDLVDDDADIALLQSWENLTSGIDHAQRQIERPFQYGDTHNTLAVFDSINWRPGRFGDGLNYGVWYGALERETSIQETLYGSYQFVKEDLKESHDPIVIDRKMFEAHIQSECVIDLQPLHQKHPRLTHSTDYSLCCELGAHAHAHGIEAYLTPSARKLGGCCVPVFKSSVIKKDRVLFYFHFTFFKDGRVRMTTDKDEWVQIP